MERGRYFGNPYTRFENHDVTYVTFNGDEEETYNKFMAALQSTQEVDPTLEFDQTNYGNKGTSNIHWRIDIKRFISDQILTEMVGSDEFIRRDAPKISSRYL